MKTVHRDFCSIPVARPAHATVCSPFTLLAVAGSLLLSLGGCVSMPGGEEIDARFAAGWRPSKGYCMFGGETPTLDAYCARVNFGGGGLETILQAHNDDILQASGDRKLVCTEHVARARQSLRAYAEFVTEPVYSCDDDPEYRNGRPVCHVSLLVTDTATGQRMVMDNGHVFHATVEAGVGSYAQFARRVDRMWAGTPPDGMQFALGQ